MGHFAAGRSRPASSRLESLFCAGHTAYSDLRTVDRCGPAAKRRGRRSGGRVRRCGQPDGLRSARRDYVSFEGDDLVRDHVHADVHGLDDAPEYDFVAGWQLCAAAVLEGTEEDRSSGSCAGGARTIGACLCARPSGSDSRDACSIRSDADACGSSACNNCAPGSGAIEEVGRADQHLYLSADSSPLDMKAFSPPSCGSGGTGRRILRWCAVRRGAVESPPTVRPSDVHLRNPCENCEFRSFTRLFDEFFQRANCQRRPRIWSVFGLYLDIPNTVKRREFGAAEWIRTTTVLLPPAPQAGASASSATAAQPISSHV